MKQRGRASPSILGRLEHESELETGALDDQGDLALFYQVGNVRAAFVDLEDRFALKANFVEAFSGAVGGNQVEAKVVQATGERPKPAVAPQSAC